MRIAIVHDWCVTYGGAERVLERILDLYPTADLFSLIDKVPPSQREFLRGRTPRTSFLQKIPNIEKHYRKLLSLMPHAIENFDLSAYDLIISSHYSVAKGVITAPRQVHVCYCHSPMRYAWDLQHAALAESGMAIGIKGALAKWQLHHLRQWDARCANNVDVFIANSQFIADRIWRCYRRSSQVIYPPINIDDFAFNPTHDYYYVCVGRLVPYKKIDLVVEAFTRMPHLQLVVVGDGPEMARLQKIATPNISLKGRLSDQALRETVAKAKALVFPAYEDFGIVPLEAQACGTPVIAYGKGGSLETVRGRQTSMPMSPQDKAQNLEHAPTGLHFYEQTSAAIEQTIMVFEAMSAHPIQAAHCRQHVMQFAPQVFDEKFKAAVAQGLLAQRDRHNGSDQSPA